MRDPLSQVKKCPIDGCENVHPKRYLMCAYHWHKVSAQTQRLVYKSLRACQAGTLSFNVYEGHAAQAKKEAVA